MNLSMIARGCLLTALLLAATAAVRAQSERPAEELTPAEAREHERLRKLFGGAEPDTAASWDAAQFDPAPSGRDAAGTELRLPMPCGGAMMFRRIDVGGGPGLLAESRLELGAASETDGPEVDRWVSYLSGTFGGGTAGFAQNRYFYLGKYEVTTLQYRVLKGSCPQPLRGRRPAVRVSWYDAVDFTRRYTEWLYRAARDALPEEDGVRGFLRLPTEAEWEFAARGGLAVDANAFRHVVFPLAGGTLGDYAWFRESVASSFEPRPVGALLPNPLGLHDMLGNAAELVFDLFRLPVSGRMHGQSGGFAVKGGHFRSWRKSLGTSWRREHPHFNPRTGTANRLDTVGFRVAISAPVLTSDRRIEALRDEHARRKAESETLADGARCGERVLELRSTLSAWQSSLARCLAGGGQLEVPAFPEPPAPAAAAAPELGWDELRSRLEAMSGAEIRAHAIRLLGAREPDRALLLLKRSARKGDGWSALAIGAMYDPRLFAAAGFDPARTPFSKPNPDLARCWYQLAHDLGDGRAMLRLGALDAREPQEEQSPAAPPSGCDSILEGYGTR